jgi:hypothetical protein
MFARKPRVLQRGKHHVVLGGRRIAVRPMNLEHCLELVLLLAPYVGAVERYLPDLRAALKDTSGRRPDLLPAALRAMAGDMQSAPGDITRAVALLAGVDARWLAQSATAEEILKALPALGEANNLWALLSELRRWGTLKYQSPGKNEEIGNA